MSRSPSAPAWRLSIVLTLWFALPRVLRLASGKVWVEDPYYLTTPWLLLDGQRPYTDFSAPYMVWLEYLYAGLLAVFGVSFTSFEVATALLFLACSWLLYGVGRAVTGRWEVGLLAGSVLTWHPLVFRYHVQHRENFTTLAACLAYWLIFRETEAAYPRPRWRALLGAAVVLGLGALAKQSVAAHAVPLCAWLLVARREFWRSAAFGVAFNGFYALVLAFTWWLYGRPFYLQAIFFHFVKGGNDTPRWLGTCMELGSALPVALLGMALGSAVPRWRSALWWVLALDLACNYAFFEKSLTFWPHYMVAMLPAVCLGAGFALFLAGDALRALLLREDGALGVGNLAALVGVPLMLSLVLTPWFRSPLPGWEALGFGGKDRRMVARLARFTRERVPATATVMVPDWLSFAAQRRNLINFKDNLGNMMLIERMDRLGKLDELRRAFDGASFAEVRGVTTAEWMPRALAAIQDRELALVGPDFEFPVEPEFLREHGYSPCLQSAELTLWCPDPEVQP